MCVAALAWRAHPRWQVVLAGNRDERHARAALPLARWRDADVIAGRDLAGGGTWLGVAGAGRLAVITNLAGHGAPDPAAPSRGGLVRDALADALPGAAALARFNPFNLIVVDGAVARAVSNRPTVHDAELTPGIHGLSNGAIDSDWPKVRRLNAAVAAWLDADRPPEALLVALAEDRGGSIDDPAADHEPRSSIFIRHPVYGTRCSTVVTVDHQGRGVIVERRYDADAAVTGETRLAFDWRG